MAKAGEVRAALDHVRAAEALTERAAQTIDAAVAAPNEDNVAAASVAVAEAKVMTTEIAILRNIDMNMNTSSVTDTYRNTLSHDSLTS